MVSHLCMYIIYRLLISLDMCVLYFPTMSLDVWYHLFVSSWCMYETMPLVRTYMYYSRKCLWEGYWYMWKTMPLIRTYIHGSRKFPLRGLLVYGLGKSAFEWATDICEKQCFWLGLTCIVLGNHLWEGWCMTLGKIPLGRLLIYVKNNASN